MGANGGPHDPDVGLTHLLPAAPDLQRTPKPILAKHKIVGLERGWKEIRRSTQCKGSEKLVGFVLGLQGCLDSRDHSWAESVPGKVRPQPPRSNVSGFLPRNLK